MLAEDPTQDKHRFETDTQKIVRRHLSDPNHVISEEEIRNVRIGMDPSTDAATEQAVQDGEDRIADHKSDSEDDTIPGGQKMTPWEVVDPS